MRDERAIVLFFRLCDREPASLGVGLSDSLVRLSSARCENAAGVQHVVTAAADGPDVFQDRDAVAIAPTLMAVERSLTVKAWVFAKPTLAIRFEFIFFPNRIPGLRCAECGQRDTPQRAWDKADLVMGEGHRRRFP